MRAIEVVFRFRPSENNIAELPFFDGKSKVLMQLSVHTPASLLMVIAFI